ncbi:hypothetical protein D5086_029952 [Populus alba]|uniref:Uncharacterized protein n=1 Tax=Populus alba TaxID=43335 RepID=A0ACC4AMR2_POPAL
MNLDGVDGIHKHEDITAETIRSILSHHYLAVAATDAQCSCICSAGNIVVIGATMLAAEEEKVSLQK